MATHLHLHTRYSLQIGYGASEDFAAAAPAGSALAITDTQSMAGILEHDKACAKYGHKPIFGLETFVAGPHRLVLLAETDEGLRNLYALAGIHGAELGYARLAMHAQGVIALTGHIGGAIPTAIMRADKDSLAFHLKQLLSIFGRDHLFLEKVDWGLREQQHINTKIDEIAERTKLRAVWTNDVHYPRREDALAQALLVCDKLGKAADMSELLCHRVDDAWLTDLKDPVAEEIAQRCVARIERHKPLLPTFSEDDNRLLGEIAWAGLDARGFGQDEAYRRRQEFELSVIQRMGFSGYYLIVSDAVAWGRSKGIPFGMGRGSGPGSIVAWTSKITHVDPVRHKLYFERFLNPERVSMPDFDIDIAASRREEMLDYLRSRYGEDNVAQISSWGTYKPKLSWQSAGRVLGLSRAETLLVSKRHMSRLEENATMQGLIDSGHFDVLMRESPRYEGVLRAAAKMERGMRTHGRHAGGIVVIDRPVSQVMPLAPGGITAYDHKRVEEVGGVKFDFLGVKELDVLDVANACLDYAVDILNLPEDDQKTWALIQSGHHVGLFQIEGDGMSAYVTDLAPTNIGELAAAVALYRPGPMDTLPRGQHEVFADRKNGRAPVEYLHQDMEQVLGETYAVIVYQEQILFLAQIICGMSMGAADILRRAIGKKDAKLLEQQRSIFIDGALARGYGESFVRTLWDQIETFARYGFNRAHAVVYAYLCYQTAYMKANYPAEFIGAQAHVRGDNLSEVHKFTMEARRMGLHVVMPDISSSPALFYGKGDTVVWGLSSLGGIGLAYARALVQARPWADMRDFIDRAGCDASQFSALLYAGALDGLIAQCPGMDGVLDEDGHIAPDRAALIYPMVAHRFKSWARDKKGRAVGGFTVTFEHDDLYRFRLPDAVRPTAQDHAAYWQLRACALGTWGAHHPCDGLDHVRAMLGCVQVNQLGSLIGEQVRVLCVVGDLEYKVFKNKDGEMREMAKYTISDTTGSFGVVQFDGLDACRPWSGLMLVTLNVRKARRGHGHDGQVASLARIDVFGEDGPVIIPNEPLVKPVIEKAAKPKRSKSNYNPDQVTLF